MYKIKLSPYAKTFYTEWLLNQNSSRYNLSIDQTLYGKLDVDRLRAALKRYITEHVLLNSHIKEIDGEPHWVQNNSIDELEYSDNSISTLALLPYVSRSFDLHNESLYRFKLFRIEDGVYRFIVVMHHLVMDGSPSLDSGIFKAISNYYNDENYEEKCSVEEQVALVANLTDVLSTRLEQNKNKYQEFWQKQLFGVENIDLSFLKLTRACDKENIDKNTAETCNQIREIGFSFGAAELAKLNQIKLKYSVTLYIYGQCIFALLLHKYTSQERLAIAYPIAIKEGLDFIYGSQINTNLIPYQFKTKNIIELFNQSKEFFKLTTREDIKYGYYPVADIIQESNGKDLLDIYFAQTFFREKPFEFQGITKVELHTELATDGVVTKDTLLFEQDGRNYQDRLNYRVRYDIRTIDTELLNNFVTSYKKIFLEVLEDLLHGNENKLIADYCLLDEAQYKKIVYEFNQTAKDYPRDKTIKELFEEQVQRSPNQIAITYKNQHLTYQELNEKTNQLARMMQERGVAAGVMVGICMEHNLNLLVGLLATIKAGGTYVPLDPNYPSERIGFILKETKIKLILTQKSIIKRLPILSEGYFTTIPLDYEADIAKFDCGNLQSTHKPSDLMYVIYTSGSTGKPKGVQITHANVASLLVAMQLLLPLKSNDRFLAITSIAFDIAGFEIYQPLVTGAQIVMVAREVVTDPQILAELISQLRITHMQATPVLWKLLVDSGWEGKRDLTMFCTGEALPQALASILVTKGKELWNLYGPTETTIWSTVGQIRIGDIPHIGKPIANTQIYILDPDKRPIPIGAIGELYIGGEGVGKGYLGREDLNAKNFVESLFDNSKSNLLYKTGDLVRMLPNGTLEYIGRNDFQVKISGHRIELGEIESNLAKYPEVKQVAVVAKELKVGNANDKYLVAYYVASNKLDEAKLRNYLATRLPEYMLPNIFVHLDRLPVLTSGKLDRKALLEFETNATVDQYMAPIGEKEQLICKEFAKILGLEKVGVNDDFFMLGGNSLKAITLTSILQANFDIKISDIFNLRTPKLLAENAIFGTNVLRQKLKQVKLSYQNKLDSPCHLDAQLQKKIDRYLKNINGLHIDYSLHKPITSVLLSGATGYLGCNILNQLLKSTNYNVYLLIRANSYQEAIERINKKFQFYFDKTLEDLFDARIFVIKSDIEKKYLGLDGQEYQSLVTKIDSIIHCAALVKHYGEYDKFYSANVQATINLLELAKLTKLKDFHYISTYSVLNFGFAMDSCELIYTEDDLPNNPEKYYNVYTKTKLQGEQQVIKYREYGIKSNIYRAGNLAFMKENYRTQENLEDNAFSNWLKCLLKIQCIAQDISKVEISQTDLTAQAIVKLFDKERLSNSIYHVFNPYLTDLSKIFAECPVVQVKTITIDQFIDNISDHLSNDIYHELIVKFLLRQGWLDEQETSNLTIEVLQNRTQKILKQLGFEWSPVTSAMFSKYLELLKL